MYLYIIIIHKNPKIIILFHCSDFELEYINEVFSWDDKVAGAKVLLAEATGSSQYVNAMNDVCEAYKSTPKSPGGRSHFMQWGSNRYASNAAFICLRVRKERVIFKDSVSSFSENKATSPNIPLFSYFYLRHIFLNRQPISLAITLSRNMPLDKLNTCWEALVEALSAVLETILQPIHITGPQVAQVLDHATGTISTILDPIHKLYMGH